MGPYVERSNFDPLERSKGASGEDSLGKTAARSSVLKKTSKGLSRVKTRGRNWVHSLPGSLTWSWNRAWRRIGDWKTPGNPEKDLFSHRL